MTPDSVTPKKVVLVSLALMGVIAVYREKQGGASGSLYKRLWGLGVIGGILSVAADFAPTVAGPFAVLMLLGSLTNGGDKAIQNLLSSVSSKVPTARSPVVMVGPSGPSQTRLGPGPGMSPPEVPLPSTLPQGG